MSCLIVGVLFGAIVLENTDTFTFYIAISTIDFIAFNFFWLLRPVKQKSDEKEATKVVYNFKEDVKDTFKLVFQCRMSALHLVILQTSINLGIYASVFINMMTDTMEDKTEWDSNEKTSKALLCMLGLGAGSIVGWLFFGRITDKCSIKVTVLLNVIATTIAYGCLFLYTAIYKFSFPLAIAMTFTWGAQDAGATCLVNCMLGF